jgi:hypothetical protein
MLRIQLLKGHHKFKAPIQIHNPKGQKLDKARMVGPGDCFDVLEDSYELHWAYRAKKLGVTAAAPAPKIPEAPEIPAPAPAPKDPLEGVVYTPEALEAMKVVELREIAKALGCKGYSSAKEATLITKIMEAKPVEEDLTPSPEWSMERLKGYLEEEGVAYDTEDPAELAALAQAHYLGKG